MLNTLLNLFGRSPFMPLELHMEKVFNCVHKLPDLFVALESKDYAKLQEISDAIAEMEHQADLAKNDIRNNMTKGLYLPIEKNNLMSILSLQDSVADATEDVAVLITLKPLVMLDSLREDFHLFLHKNIEAFDGAHRIIKEMHELLESSFSGTEAEKVRGMVEEVAVKEHEVDLIQRRLLKKLYQSENEMTYTSFDLWQRIFQAIASISNLSENLAYRVRMTLELK